MAEESAGIEVVREGNPYPGVPTVERPQRLCDRMMQWFAYDHLPKHLQEASKPFSDLAWFIDATVSPGPERTVALRKLLEAKDAAVRAVVKPGG